RREDLGSPALDQLAYADFLDRGELDRHLRRTRLHYRRRRDTLVATLRRHAPGLRVHGVAAGLHLLVTLPGLDEPGSDAALADRARRAGVAVHPLSRHRISPGPPGLVLGYAAATPDRLREAARRLGALVT
ncbi:MAG: PLP-dependent aminotransferase family protein, partial [Pseudonocardia sp.]